jgi:hypothetical protein
MSEANKVKKKLLIILLNEFLEHMSEEHKIDKHLLSVSISDNQLMLLAYDTEYCETKVLSQ